MEKAYFAVKLVPKTFVIQFVDVKRNELSNYFTLYCLIILHCTWCLVRLLKRKQESAQAEQASERGRDLRAGIRRGGSEQRGRQDSLA